MAELVILFSYSSFISLKNGRMVHASLDLDLVEPPSYFLQFVDLPDEEVSVALVHFGVRDVDHLCVDEEVHLRSGILH